MITMRFSGRTPTPGTVSAGMETDQNVEKMRFILPQISDSQSAQLCLMLPDNSPEVVEIEDGCAALPGSVTQTPGRSRAWVEILGADTVAWNSEIFYLDVGDLPPISEAVERNYPTLLMEAVMAGKRAETAAQAARAALSILMARSSIIHIAMEDGKLKIDTAMVGDEDAYSLAVLNGYEGTEEEWDGYMETLENGNWSSDVEAQLTAIQTLAQNALTTAQAKAKAKHAQIAIDPADWTGEEAPYTAQKACSVVKATDQLVLGIGESATAAAQKEIARAQITCTAQEDGRLTFRAVGGLPAVIVPVNILALEE